MFCFSYASRLQRRLVVFFVPYNECWSHTYTHTEREKDKDKGAYTHQVTIFFRQFCVPSTCLANARIWNMMKKQKLRRRRRWSKKRYNDSALSHQLFSHFVHIWIERHATHTVHVLHFADTKNSSHLKRNRIVYLHKIPILKSTQRKRNIKAKKNNKQIETQRDTPWCTNWSVFFSHHLSITFKIHFSKFQTKAEKKWDKINWLKHFLPIEIVSTRFWGALVQSIQIFIKCVFWLELTAEQNKMHLHLFLMMCNHFGAKLAYQRDETGQHARWWKE